MTCIVSRNWLLGGYQASFTLQTPLAENLIPALAHSLLYKLRGLLSDLTTSHELSNMKGRDTADVLLSGYPAPLHDEIFTIGGTIATAHDSRGFIWSPFRFSILSNFSRFEGASGIVFSLLESRSETIPEWLSWWVLGAAAPIRLEYLRVGLEAFTAKFSISRFGSIPVVSDSLLIDISCDSLALKLTTQQPRKQRCNPLETVPAFKQVSEAIGSVLGISLSSQFALELEASGSFKR